MQLLSCYRLSMQDGSCEKKQKQIESVRTTGTPTGGESTGTGELAENSEANGRLRCKRIKLESLTCFGQRCPELGPLGPRFSAGGTVVRPTSAQCSSINLPIRLATSSGLFWASK